MEQLSANVTKNLFDRTLHEADGCFMLFLFYQIG